MLFLLLSAVFSITDSYQLYNTIDMQSTSAFDIKLKSSNYGEFTLTKNGWNVLIDIDGQRIPMFGRNEGKINFGKVSIKTEFSYPYLLQNLILVKFTVTNSDHSEPHRISLSCSAEHQIRNFPQSYFSWSQHTEHHRGIQMTTGSFPVIELIAKDGYQVENVDSIWFGPISSGSYHFKNKTDDSDSYQENGNAFSFSWIDRNLEPDEVKSFSVILTFNTVNNKEPAYIMMDPITTDYLPGSKITVTGRVYSTFQHPKKQTVTINYGYSDAFPAGSATVSGNLKNGGMAFSIPITVPQSYGRYPYKISATDQNGMETNDVDFYIYVNTRPVLGEVIVHPNSNVYVGGSFEFASAFYDEKSCKLRYSIDNGVPRTVESVDMGSNGMTSFNKIFPARSDVIKTFGRHNISIWIEDEFQFKSDLKTYIFYYKPDEVPTIRMTSGTKYETFVNNPVTVEMLINYPVPYKQLTLARKIPSAPLFENIYSQQSRGEPIPFTDLINPEELSLSIGSNTIFYKIMNQQIDFITNITINVMRPYELFTESPESLSTQSLISNEISSVQVPEIHSHEAEAGAKVAFDNNNKVPKKKNTKGTIIGIGVGLVLAAVAIAIMILVYESSKKAKEYEFDSEEEKVVEISQSYCSQDNPMYSQDLPNDPFVDDFEEPNEEIICDELVDPEIK